MTKRIEIEEYILRRHNLPLLDVRAPSEYRDGHIPNAISLPLFSDEERAVIGKTYKQEGREKAILKGFDFTGLKWREFIEKALKISPNKKIGVHCWRGGMRSAAMAWALDFYGFEVFVVDGGYKGFRSWVLEQFERDYTLLVLGGKTGSHKTEILHALKNKGEQVIDLEWLAQHRGSVFGSMNKMTQPTQQQFENELAMQLKACNANKDIWVEDESHLVGKRVVPNHLYEQIRKATLIKLKIPKEQRIKFITEEYGNLDREFLIENTHRIRKRLGPQHEKQAIEALKHGDVVEFIRIVLVYYDKSYAHGMLKRPRNTIFPFEMNFSNADDGALRILEFRKHIIKNEKQLHQ